MLAPPTTPPMLVLEASPLKLSSLLKSSRYLSPAIVAVRWLDLQTWQRCSQRSEKRYWRGKCFTLHRDSRESIEKIPMGEFQFLQGTSVQRTLPKHSHFLTPDRRIVNYSELFLARIVLPWIEKFLWWRTSSHKKPYTCLYTVHLC